MMGPFAYVLNPFLWLCQHLLSGRMSSFEAVPAVIAFKDKISNPKVRDITATQEALLSLQEGNR